jgi:hypothetical protein
LFNTWLAFEILELEMNFDNFIRVTCISYTDLWKFYLSKLHALTTGRLYMCEFFSNNTFLLRLHMLLLNELYELMYQPIQPIKVSIVIEALTRRDIKHGPLG